LGFKIGRSAVTSAVMTRLIVTGIFFSAIILNWPHTPQRRRAAPWGTSRSSALGHRASQFC
jgi:hypothetical protein